MDIQAILATYDAMFGKYTLASIEAYLYEHIEKAREQSETSVLFTLLNEMIGFCRDTTQKEKALKYCKELLELLDAMKLEGSMEYATSLLNIANAYRAFGLLKTSLELFEQVEQIYKQNLETKDAVYYYFSADALKEEVTYSTDSHHPANLQTISVKRAREIIDMNRRGEKPLSLGGKQSSVETVTVDYQNVVGQDDLTRFDKKKRESNNHHNRSNSSRNRNRNNRNRS